MLERLARLCVGVGALWVVVVVFVGLATGLDKPAAWFRLLDGFLDPGIRSALYWGLAWLVVPVGILTCLRDILFDLGPLWAKMAAPGACVSVYGLFLAAALPDIGRPLLLAADPAAANLVPGVVLDSGLEAGWSWLLRFAVAFVLLAGIPGIVGAVVGWLAALGSRARR